MKLCAVSPFTTASRDEILSFLTKATAGLVVLPLWCKNNDIPTPQEIQRVIHRGVAVFVEHGESKSKATPYLVTCDQTIPMPRQIFGGTPTAGQIDSLITAWPDRTFRSGSRKVTFVLCGDITGFDPNGGMKHKRVSPTFDILANPTHTVMGRWHILGPKLSALSKGRMVIHVANNDRNHANLKTDVRIYINGKSQNHKVERGGKLAWCKCEI